jgi:uncharacterized protein YegL
MSKEIQKVDSTISTTKTNKLDLSKFNNAALSSALANIELPRLFHQLVIFILDASESMTWEGISGETKGEEIHNQIVPIIERLQSSKNKNCFDVSMIAFSQETNEFIKNKKATEIDTKNFDFNPCSHVGNYKTEIVKSLAITEDRINSYFKKNSSSSQALIIILSDGALDDQLEALEICRNLKNNNKVTIASYLLEDMNWKNTLSENRLKLFQNNIKELSSLDSNGLHFFHSKVDPTEIRNHMIKSISTVSKID